MGVVRVTWFGFLIIICYSRLNAEADSAIIVVLVDVEKQSLQAGLAEYI